VWFGHSGSDANEAALRCVLGATGRNWVIGFAGAYHGGSVGSMAISGHPSLDEGARLPGLLQVPYPDPALDPDGAATLAAIDDLLETRCRPEDVAAVWVEPILSDGGVVVPPGGFLAALADRCSPHGILLACDEVKAGLGRTGFLHAFESDGITPDIVCLGKGLGGGLPVSAFIGPVEVTDHATAYAMLTTAGNPVCAAAGLAVLETIEREDLVRRAAEMGRRLTDALSGLAARHRSIGDVRGRGLMIGVEVVHGEDDTPDPTATAKVCYRAFELGVVIFSVGVHGNVLEFTPALTIATEEIERAVATLDRAFADVEAGLVPDEAIAPFAGW
jgi:4-aminobutyrate aminotransferase